MIFETLLPSVGHGTHNESRKVRVSGEPMSRFAQRRARMQVPRRPVQSVEQQEMSGDEVMISPFARVVLSLVLVLVAVIGFAETPSESDSSESQADQRSLKAAVGDRFQLGVGVGYAVLDDPVNAALIRKHFEILTPENCMKPQSLHPAEDRWDFQAADRIADFARENQLELVGHCLVWAKDDRTDAWMMEENGQPVSRDVLLHRIEEHIRTVVERYADVVTTWDVVNEAIGDSDDGLLRDSVYSRTTGIDFLVTAFKAVRAKDPDALLVYNDYNGHKPGKREKLIELLKELKEAGAPVDAYGMQGHFELGDDSIPQLRETFDALRKLNIQVVVSELDIDVVTRGRWWADGGKYRDELASFDPYKDGLPDEIEQQQIDQYVELFKLFDQYSDMIARVSFWNLHDGQSWLNYFPWQRVNHPLLFDRDAKPKPVFDAVYEVLQKQSSSHSPGRSIPSSADETVKAGSETVVSFIVGDYLKSEGGTWDREQSPLSDPFGVDFDSAGAMYIIELETGRLHRRLASGKLQVLRETHPKGFAGDGGPITQAQFNGPHNCVVTADNQLLIADSWNHCVRSVDLKTMRVSTIAGTGESGYSGDGGPASQARFDYVMCIALDPSKKTLHVADLRNRRVRDVDLFSGRVTTIAGNGEKAEPIEGAPANETPLIDPRAVASDAAGNLYILERNANCLRMVRPDGTIHTVAGTGERGWRDGKASQSMFGAPKHICCDPAGNVYIADDANGAVRKYDPRTRTVTTLLGRGFGDKKITLRKPHGVRWHEGSLFIVDTGNNRIMRINTNP